MEQWGFNKWALSPFSSCPSKKDAECLFGDGRTIVLTIVHRLDSVLDVNRIVVMDADRVAETGTQEQLLCDRGSHLSRLVRAD